MAAKTVVKKPEPKKLKPKGETMEEQQDSIIVVTHLDNIVARFGQQFTRIELSIIERIRMMFIEEEGEKEEDTEPEP